MTNLSARKRSLNIIVAFIIIIPVICSVILPTIFHKSESFKQFTDFKQLNYEGHFVPQKSNGYSFIMPSSNYESYIRELKNNSRSIFHWKNTIFSCISSTYTAYKQSFLVLCVLYFLVLLAGYVSVVALSIGGHAPPEWLYTKKQKIIEIMT